MYQPNSNIYKGQCWLRISSFGDVEVLSKTFLPDGVIKNLILSNSANLYLRYYNEGYSIANS